MLSETDHLIILADNLGCTFRKVQSERRLVGAKIVDVEDQFFGKVFGRAPHDPADTGVDLKGCQRIATALIR